MFQVRGGVFDGELAGLADATGEIVDELRAIPAQDRRVEHSIADVETEEHDDAAQDHADDRNAQGREAEIHPRREDEEAVDDAGQDEEEAGEQKEPGDEGNSVEGAGGVAVIGQAERGLAVERIAQAGLLEEALTLQDCGAAEVVGVLAGRTSLP